MLTQQQITDLMAMKPGLTPQSYDQISNIQPDSKFVISRQATLNIGTIGHVSHGKSTVVKAISGINVRPIPPTSNVDPRPSNSIRKRRETLPSDSDMPMPRSSSALSAQLPSATSPSTRSRRTWSSATTLSRRRAPKIPRAPTRPAVRNLTWSSMSPSWTAQATIFLWLPCLQELRSWTPPCC